MKDYLTFITCANYNKKLFEEMKLKDDEAYEICKLIAENALISADENFLKNGKDISYDEFMEYLKTIDFNFFKIMNDTLKTHPKDMFLILSNFALNIHPECKDDTNDDMKPNGNEYMCMLNGITAYATNMKTAKKKYRFLKDTLPFPEVLLARVSGYDPFDDNTEEVNIKSSFISVAEKMPEQGETVLIRFKDGHYDKGITYELSWSRNSNGSFNTSTGVYVKDVIDAWLPLPY